MQHGILLWFFFCRIIVSGRFRLSGIIGAFMAGGVPARDAAAMGAYVHGSAGDLARERFGLRSARPSDVIESIPEVLRGLEMVDP